MVIDVVSFGETMFRLTPPTGSRLENTAHLNIYIGGTESNVLASLARLNFKVSWLSALPDNPMGRNVAQELRSHGIDTSHVVWADETSRLGIFYAEESPEPLGLQVHYDRAGSACALIDPDAVNYAVVDDARMLHLTGITPALSEQAREVFVRFLKRARDHQIPLSFDVNYRAKLCSTREAAEYVEEACQQARILFCSGDDAAELWGISGSAEEILRQMAERFGNGDPEKAIVITTGSAGAAQLQHSVYSREDVFPTDGRARFGSGDAFDAGYLYAYLQGSLYQELKNDYPLTPLTFGNALASLKRCLPGDSPAISPADVRTILQRNEKRRFR